MTTFTPLQLEAIAGALGDMSGGLTDGEVSFLLQVAGIPDPDPRLGKRQRLFSAFVSDQTTRKDRTHILAFIGNALRPERFEEPERFEPMRINVNRALAYAGLTVTATGKLEAVEMAAMHSEASRRAREFRGDLAERDVHHDVFRVCQQELLVDNYVHAVAEAVKGVADKIRSRTGLEEDGVALVDRAFGGNPPLLALNGLASESEWSEQAGFTNLLKGVFGLFRNPVTHEPEAYWQMTRPDAVDLLSLVSLLHRRIDAATRPARV